MIKEDKMAVVTLVQASIIYEVGEIIKELEAAKVLLEVGSDELGHAVMRHVVKRINNING